MAIFKLFTPAVKTLVSLHICAGISHALAAKALASLHIYTGSPEPRHSTEISCAGSNSDLMLSSASSEGSGESVNFHRLTSAFVLRAASNGDLCTIHASSVDSGESAHLRRHSHWTMR